LTLAAPVPLRLIVYDRTCINRFGFGLSRAWSSGRLLYAALGRCDGAYGAASVDQALNWLAKHRIDRPIGDVQFWSHGKWGRLLIGKESLDRTTLSPGARLNRSLGALRERLAKGARIWFRACETFGALAGHDFASAFTDFMGCSAAGHTFVIGYWQSGLHSLAPGKRPHWLASEGLVDGSAERPVRAAWSSVRAPNTISCLTNRVPQAW
jgi:hypothetical protein